MVDPFHKTMINKDLPRKGSLAVIRSSRGTVNPKPFLKVLSQKQDWSSSSRIMNQSIKANLKANVERMTDFEWFE